MPIEAPCYAVPRGANNIDCLVDGLVVDGNFQCLDVDMNPIEGLFAVGNASGPFFGGGNYPMDIEGLSVGRAITTGYVTRAATSPACRLANGAFLTLPLSRRPSPGVGFAVSAELGTWKKRDLPRIGTSGKCGACFLGIIPSC